MRYLLCISFLLLASGFSYGQHDARFTQNMFNRLYVNPAYAGSENSFQAISKYRTQNLGIGGRPQSGLFSIDAPVHVLKGGIGGTFWFDNFWEEKTIGFKAAYAFKIPIGKGNLNLGIDGGFSNLSSTGWNNSSYSYTAYDLSLGGYYYMDNFYAGISTTHLLQTTYDVFSSHTLRQYYLMTAYNYHVHPKYSIEPSLLVKYDDASIQADINITFHVYDKYWLGTTYRPDDAVALIAGVKFKTLWLCYSRDIPISILRQYYNGNHEITLAYIFNRLEKTVPTE